jgi:hypothetical protein
MFGLVDLDARLGRGLPSLLLLHSRDDGRGGEEVVACGAGGFRLWGPRCRSAGRVGEGRSFEDHWGWEVEDEGGGDTLGFVVTTCS